MSAVIEFRPGILSQQEVAFRSAKCTQTGLQDLEVQLRHFRLQRHQRAMKSNGVRPIAFLTLLLLLGTTIAGGAFLMCSREASILPMLSSRRSISSQQVLTAEVLTFATEAGNIDTAHDSEAWSAQDAACSSAKQRLAPVPKSASEIAVAIHNGKTEELLPSQPGAVPTHGFDGAVSDMDNHRVAHGVVVTKDKQLESDTHDVLATIANGESPETGESDGLSAWEDVKTELSQLLLSAEGCWMLICVIAIMAIYSYERWRKLSTQVAHLMKRFLPSWACPSSTKCQAAEGQVICKRTLGYDITVAAGPIVQTHPSDKQVALKPLTFARPTMTWVPVRRPCLTLNNVLDVPLLLPRDLRIPTYWFPQEIITGHGERTVRSRLSARRLVALPNLHAEPARSMHSIIWVDAAMLRQLSSCAQVAGFRGPANWNLHSLLAQFGTSRPVLLPSSRHVVRCDSDKTTGLQRQIRILERRLRKARSEGQSLEVKAKARESLLNTKVHQLTGQIEHERSVSSKRQTFFTKRESQVLSERDAAQSKLSDARCELVHHKTQYICAREAADKAQRCVKQDSLGLQAQRDRLRVFAQESEDVLKASKAKEEQALQRVATLETNFATTMERLSDAYERDQATIKAMETTAAEQEGAIKRELRQLEKDRKEAAEVLADALKVQKRHEMVLAANQRMEKQLCEKDARLKKLADDGHKGLRDLTARQEWWNAKYLAEKKSNAEAAAKLKADRGKWELKSFAMADERAMLREEVENLKEQVTEAESAQKTAEAAKQTAEKNLQGLKAQQAAPQQATLSFDSFAKWLTDRGIPEQDAKAMACHADHAFKQELATAQSQQLSAARNQVLQLQQAVTQLVSERDTAVAAATTAKTSADAREGQMLQQAQTALTAASSKHAAALTEASSKHAAALTELQNKLQQQAKSAAAQTDTEHAAALEKTKNQLQKGATAETAAADTKHTAALEKLKTMMQKESKAALAAATAQHDAVLEKVRADLLKGASAETVAANTEHTADVEKLKAQFQKTFDAELGKANTKHTAEVAKLQNELVQQQQATAKATQEVQQLKQASDDATACAATTAEGVKQKLDQLQQQVTATKEAGEKVWQQLQNEQHSKAALEEELRQVKAELHEAQQQPQQKLAELAQQVTNLKEEGEKAMQQLQAEQHSKAEVETKFMTVQAQLSSLQQQPQQVQAGDASVDQSQAAKAMLKNAKKWERALEKREKEVALQKSIVEQLKLFLAEELAQLEAQDQGAKAGPSEALTVDNIVAQMEQHFGLVSKPDTGAARNKRRQMEDVEDKMDDLAYLMRADVEKDEARPAKQAREGAGPQGNASGQVHAGMDDSGQAAGSSA